MRGGFEENEAVWWLFDGTMDTVQYTCGLTC